MNNNEQNYLNKIKENIVKKISDDINEGSIDKIIEKILKICEDEKKFINFHKYYFTILENKKYLLKEPDFFRVFKTKYSLQVINKEYLYGLEKHKSEIYSLIINNKLSELYFDNFYKAKIKTNNNIIHKSLNSFFTKLVHTYSPNEYSALDNPIKNYFGLKNESFYISFIVISSSYKYWASENKNLMKTIRNKFEQKDKNCYFQHDKISVMKLLDLIFWCKANKK